MVHGELNGFGSGAGFLTPNGLLLEYDLAAGEQRLIQMVRDCSTGTAVAGLGTPDLSELIAGYAREGNGSQYGGSPVSLLVPRPS